MSQNQIIILEKGASLNVDKKRLKISIDHKDYFFAFSDIAVLYLDYYAIQLTNSVLKNCGENNVVLIVSDEKHLPCLLSLPFVYNNRRAGRNKLQAIQSNSTKSEIWWKQIVQARIGTEILQLHSCGIMDTQVLKKYRDQVLPADTSMVEAKAARVYWNSLLGNNFKRIQQGAEDYINSCLNYGYAILRALVARVVSSYGLIPSFGLGHTRKDNPFNLVEDIMEPFRYLVENYVYTHPQGAFNAKTRLDILGITENTVLINNKRFRLISAIELMVQSYCQLLESSREEFLMPGFDSETTYDEDFNITEIIS